MYFYWIEANSETGNCYLRLHATYSFMIARMLRTKAH